MPCRRAASVVRARNGAGRCGERRCVVLVGEVIVAFVRRHGVGVLPEEVADDDEERQADRDRDSGRAGGVAVGRSCLIWYE
ncbi:MAG: hypothetical protein GXY82_01730 [Methanospirillum sp.]|nr:hypothetical protein [Methanospirillum sp.]